MEVSRAPKVPLNILLVVHVFVIVDSIVYVLFKRKLYSQVKFRDV